jgi:hypothetical protein
MISNQVLFKIKAWIQNQIDNNFCLEFDDIYIDQIDPEFEKTDMWFDGAIECFRGNGAILIIDSCHRNQLVSRGWVAAPRRGTNQVVRHWKPSLPIKRVDRVGIKG